MKTAALLTSFLFTIFGITLDLTPNIPVLLVAVFSVMGVDFITGVIKAKMKGKERTSEGYRRTVKKVTQYLTAICLSFGLQYLVKVNLKNGVESLQYLNMFVMVFIIYIEITSILENLWEIDQRSMMAKFFIKPLLTIMKFGLTKNPIQQAQEKITTQNNTDETNTEK